MSKSSGVSRQQSNGGNTAQLVLWGEVDCTQVDESTLNDWWTNEHLPERLSINGFSRARRYYTHYDLTNKTHYLTIYDVTDLQVLKSDDYMDKLNNPTPRTKEHLPTLASMNRAACRIVHHQERPELQSCGSMVGNGIAMGSFYLPGEDDIEKILKSVAAKFSNLQKSKKQFMSFSVLQEDSAATEPGSSSESYKGVNLSQNDNNEGVRIVFLLEFSATSGLPLTYSRGALVHAIDQFRNLLPDSANIRVFELMCCLSQ